MVQAIGRHRVACSSIEAAPHSELLDGAKANVLFTDPPWSNQMMSYFDTLQAKQTSEGGDGNISAEAMLDELAHIIENHVDGYLFVFWTVHNNLAQERLSDCFAWMEEQHPVYGRDGETRKYVLLCGATDSKYRCDVNVNGMKGAMTTTHTIFEEIATPGAFVYDPMCGQGNTAVGAIKQGMRFAGNELNRKRVNDAVDRIKAAEARWGE